MRSTTTILCALLLGVTPVMADLAPPPVALELAGPGEIVPGRPFEIRVSLVNRTAESLEGTLEIESSRPGDWVMPPSPLARTLAPGAKATLEVPLKAPANLVPQELRLTWTTSADTPARLRAFVRPGPKGWRLLDVHQLLALESMGSVRIEGRSRRAFGLEARSIPRLTADEPAPKMTVKGALTFTSQKGDILPVRRARVALTTGPGAEPTVVARGNTGPDGSFAFEIDPPATAAPHTVTFFTETDRWLIGETSEKAYVWRTASFDSGPGEIDLGTLLVPPDQVAEEAFWIHEDLNKALDAFEKGVDDDLAWWTQIPVNWPSDGDYYSWGTVNVTLAEQWDVVGHEFGHAIFHYGSSSSSSGGSHKIDQCYGKTLAWSEGWASYFACVSHLAADDPDARFEFMVPRRKPIRIENVPDDVCTGSKNEWRVAAALWDLHDTHEDGADHLSLSFPVMWKAMHEGQNLSSVEEYVAFLKQRLEAAVQTQVDETVRHNTIEP